MKWTAPPDWSDQQIEHYLQTKIVGTGDSWIHFKGSRDVHFFSIGNHHYKPRRVRLMEKWIHQVYQGEISPRFSYNPER